MGIIERSSRPIRTLATSLAVAGGMVLVLLALLTGLNIIGRAFIWAGLKPIRGDVELVETGIAFAVAAFMPWCQLRRAHASVTLFADRWGVRTNALLDLVSDTFLTLIAALLMWRHAYGLLDKVQYGETTFILQFPIWWGYAGVAIGLCVWIIVGAWTMAADVQALIDGKAARSGAGALH